MPTTLITAFLLFSALNAITPGPNVLFVLRASMVGGRGGAQAAVAGLCTATIGWGLLAATGATAAFDRLPALFVTMKIVGAGYVFWLGFQLAARAAHVSAATEHAGVPEAALQVSGARFFGQGFLTSLLNPTTFIFFLAVFPQFLNREDMSVEGAALLVVLFVSIHAAWYTIVMHTFEIANRRAMNGTVSRWSARIVGGALMCFGAFFLSRL